MKVREENIYDWLTKWVPQTNHVAEPLSFAATLKAAEAYAHFSQGESPRGTIEYGLLNTRTFGGSAIKQHFVLLIGGRHLPPELFTRLCDGIEKITSVWLFAGLPARDYERATAAASRALRGVKTKNKFAVLE